MKRVYLLSALTFLAAPVLHAAEPDDAMRAFLQAHVVSWTQEPVLIDAIRAQNAETADYTAARIEELDQQWRAEVGTGSAPTVDAVLLNEASDYLRQVVADNNGAMTEIFVMDAHGLNVAASGVTSDYWQGDEAKFQQTYSVGPDAMHFSEIEFDESSQTYQAQISIPITDPETGAVIGAMTVGVNAEALM